MITPTPNTHPHQPTHYWGDEVGEDKETPHLLLVLLLSDTPGGGGGGIPRLPDRRRKGRGRVEGEEGPPHTEAFVGLPSVEVETLHISSVFVPPWGRWGKGEGGQGGGWATGKGLK